MLINFALHGLNVDKGDDDTSIEIPIELDENQHPKSFMFCNDISAFCRKYCKSFDEFKLREKRFLDFETPNRALITHEYDIQVKKQFKYSEFYYLFNPIKRLSWLKISQEGKRLSVARESKVKDIIKGVIIEELLFFSDPNEIFEKLWKYKKGLPCFIKLEKTEFDNFLLTASYSASIEAEKVKNKFKERSISFLSPLLERRIKYAYFPLEGKSSWLYIKSPNNFNVYYDKGRVTYNKEINEIDCKSASDGDADHDKLSLTIINSKSVSTESDTVIFNFDIIVPKSIKVWFLSVYYLSIITLLMISCNLINCIYLIFLDPIWAYNPIGELFSKNDVGGFVFAVIAMIITTRGWLISEETIFKKYSMRITCVAMLIIVFYILGLLM